MPPARFTLLKAKIKQEGPATAGKVYTMINNRKELNFTNKGFDEENFRNYLIEFYKVEGYALELVDNIIQYAHKWEHVSKDQFAEFVSDLLPYIDFAEVAAFCEDEILTKTGGQYYKELFWNAWENERLNICLA